MHNLLIKNGWIIDGTGASGYLGDIAIEGDRIVDISPRIEQEAELVIDAKGHIVCPGFIDVHTHDDLVFDKDAMDLPKLTQGVTTVITGNCGFGAAPVTGDCFRDMVDYNAPILGEQVKNHQFEYFGMYMDYMEAIDKAINIACLLPHGNVYMAANGFGCHLITEEQISKEKDYVKEAMDAGALGISFGLMYAPGCYSEDKEIEVLSKAVGERGGIVTIHMKSESDHFKDSIAAAVKLAETCKVPIEISHLKNVGKDYWGNMRETVRWLDKLREEGSDISFDMYPYTMGSTTMSILFPTEYLSDGVKALLEKLKDKTIRDKISERLKESWGEEDNLSLLCGWENVIISSVKTIKNSKWLGYSVENISKALEKDPSSAFMDLFLEEEGEVAVLLNHIAQDDMEQTLIAKGVSVASDGLPGAKAPHPRLYGTFPKFLREFVREKKLLSWESAIHKITMQPAERFGLKERGVLKKGYFADLLMFNPDTIRDRATFDNPIQLSSGIELVVVNGETAWSEGGISRAGQGRLLRRENN